MNLRKNINFESFYNHICKFNAMWTTNNKSNNTLFRNQKSSFRLALDISADFRSGKKSKIKQKHVLRFH